MMRLKRFATPLFEKNRISEAAMGGVYCHGGGGIGAQHLEAAGEGREQPRTARGARLAHIFTILPDSCHARAM